jgi:acyl-CoA reductase-like NAD-dependent aldehyde dehydrogenase
MPAHARAAILSKASLLIRERAEDFARLLAQEVGKTIKEARGEVARCVNTFSIAAEGVKWVQGETVPFDAVAGSENKLGYYVRCPAGVVLAITPFNFPLNLAAHKVAPAIAAGNSFILKPATKTPLADLLMGETLLDAGLPPRAISVIVGSGETVGMQLVRDERIRIISFTGSAEVGKQIMRVGGLKKYIMELGSNSAVIVMPDADFELAASRIAVGGFALAGQVCISVQRLVVHRSARERFLQLLIERVKKLRIGDPLDEETDMGPMISESAAARAEEWLREAIAQGAKPLLPLKREGALLHPTILDNVTPEMKVFGEELFAPAVTVTPFEQLEEAIRLVNCSRYGLQAGVFTRDINAAFRAARDIDVGGIMINEVPTYRVDLMPYGGVKDSGVGREGLKHAIEEMTEIKLVCISM